MPTDVPDVAARPGREKLSCMSHVDLTAHGSVRAEQLAWIDHQVAIGTLVIRQATPEERLRYGIGMPRLQSPPPARRRPASAPDWL